jgi:hypothetical protein
MRRTLLPLTALLTLTAAAPAAAAFTPKESVPVSNAGARNPVVSHDSRLARAIAYEQGGNLRVVQRAGPYDLDANRTWRPGRTASIAGAIAPDLSGGPADAPSLVAYMKSGSAYTARLDGSRRRVIARGVRDVAINGDSDKVAYVTARGLYVHDRVLRKSTRISSTGRNPVFGKSPKGTTSYFTYTRGGAIYRASHGRARGGTAAVSSRRLVDGTHASPHGRTVDVGYQRGDTVMRRSDALGTSTVSTNGASDPDISDGGEFVVFTTVNPNLGVPFGRSSIFIWTEKRRQNERLSPSSVNAANVETSARGNYVFYEGTDDAGPPRIWMTYLGGK